MESNYESLLKRTGTEFKRVNNKIEKLENNSELKEDETVLHGMTPGNELNTENNKLDNNKSNNVLNNSSNATLIQHLTINKSAPTILNKNKSPKNPITSNNSQQMMSSNIKPHNESNDSITQSTNIINGTTTQEIIETNLNNNHSNNNSLNNKLQHNSETINRTSDEICTINNRHFILNNTLNIRFKRQLNQKSLSSITKIIKFELNRFFHIKNYLLSNNRRNALIEVKNSKIVNQILKFNLKNESVITKIFKFDPKDPKYFIKNGNNFLNHKSMIDSLFTKNNKISNNNRQNSNSNTNTNLRINNSKVEDTTTDSLIVFGKNIDSLRAKLLAEKIFELKNTYNQSNISVLLTKHPRTRKTVIIIACGNEIISKNIKNYLIKLKKESDFYWISRINYNLITKTKENDIRIQNTFLLNERNSAVHESSDHSFLLNNNSILNNESINESSNVNN